MPNLRPEVYFSVDVETAGPYPAEYAMLSIGACRADDKDITFYCELQPDRTATNPEAMGIHGLDLEQLNASGRPPREAMEAFAAWVEASTPVNGRPIFVALNVAFDWMFVNDYFHRYLGRNPFGHNALDMKAMYMGLKRIDAVGKVRASIDGDYPRDHPLSHNALSDAIDQAHLFEQIMSEIRAR